jgi:hypothetical protein
MPRFAILEHTGAPDDPAGQHYDLLLEAGDACRTWRLAELPVAGGPPVTAVELPPHRLAWLEHVAGEVSGGRGFARRIDGGSYAPTRSTSREDSSVETIDVMLESNDTTSRLALTARGNRWIARLL